MVSKYFFCTFQRTSNCPHLVICVFKILCAPVENIFIYVLFFFWIMFCSYITKGGISGARSSDWCCPWPSIPVGGPDLHSIHCVTGIFPGGVGWVAPWRQLPGRATLHRRRESWTICRQLVHQEKEFWRNWVGFLSLMRRGYLVIFYTSPWSIMVKLLRAFCLSVTVDPTALQVG